MKAYVIFSSSEPVLVVARQTIRSKPVLNQLGRIGIHKFIAREVPVTGLRSKYGRQFEVIENALNNGTELRVLDHSGHRIFQNVPFSDFGPAYRRESHPAVADAAREPNHTSYRPNFGPVSHAGFT